MYSSSSSEEYDDSCDDEDNSCVGESDPKPSRDPGGIGYRQKSVADDISSGEIDEESRANVKRVVVKKD